MQQLDQANDNCTSCGKSKTVSAGQSLTQWIFSDDTCRCDIQFATNPNICRFCGKALTKGTFETMTQWIFHPDVCSCGVENQEFLSAVQKAISSKESDSNATANNTAPLSPRAAFIYELENNDVDCHGLPPDSFPFERFRIIEEVGRGAAGVVYQAWDCLLKRRVAIKTMHAMVMSAEEVIKLQNEARTSSRLKHPAIIRILDFGAAPNGQPYLVSDFIDGTTLESRIDEEGPLSSVEAIQMFTQLCAGIMHAHEQKVLHRDLKSSNVLISNDISDGTNIKIIDFGVARLKEALYQTAQVETSTLVGTPFYMSPEQGEGKSFDARSEVYSIGIMMFEALTGRVPFQGQSALETLAMHASKPVPEMAEINPDVDCSERLELIVLKCLEKDPNDRFQTVAELHEQLSSSRVQSADDYTGIHQETQTDREEEAKSRGISATQIVIAGVVSVAVLALGVFVCLRMTTEEEKTASLYAEKKIEKDNKEHKKERAANFNFFDGPLYTEYKPWDNLAPGNWVGSLWVKDENFADMKHEPVLNWVESPLSPDVTGAGLKYIANKPINILILNSVNLKDVALEHIAKMKTMQWLTLGSARHLSPKLLLQTLASLPNLTTLKFQDVLHPPTILEPLADKKKFESLILMDKPAGSEKTDWTPLTRMGRLRVFALLKYDFSDADLKYIRLMPKLNELRLSDLGLSDFDATKVIVAPIKILDLSCNDISDKTVATLGSIGTLKYLDLTGCPKVTTSGITSLQSKLKHCTIIHKTKNEPNRDEWSVANISKRGAILYKAEHKP